MSNFNIPPQIMQMLKSGNPQQIAMNFLQQNSPGNPMLENILNLANNGDMAGVETVCKNVIRSKGLDPDELMKNFQSQWK